MINSTNTPNRLANETSPYLLQHAYNPVDWYSWGEEAFTKAKEEDKPIFLSIGYSTCHWCHVMAHESFEDNETAEYLNQNFISIKVDKEERPDIDSIYMNVCQTLTGSGGWPLTAFMTPDQKPFFAGTYFPKVRKYGSIGFVQLLSQINDYWINKREDIYHSSEEITRAVSVSSVSDKQHDKIPGNECITRSFAYFSKSFDRKYGGFGSAPKFPSPHNLMFLLRFHIMKPETNALEMVERTIEQMYKGGIFDHIGYGFSRYSTDKEWLAPHFEKMLYDNALLVMVLSELVQITGNELYKDIISKVLSYIKSEMTSDEGGFFSAQDADSEGEEGKFYTFSKSEIYKALNDFRDQDIESFCQLYDITDSGNFEGKNILNLIKTENFHQIEFTDEMRLKLYEYRKNRYTLHKDDKILTSWNALMIIAYVKAYKSLKNESYLESAIKALKFIESKLTDNNENLYITYRDGKSKGKGLLDDHAFMLWAYIELYEATFDVDYLTRAIDLKNKIYSKFSDEPGGFYINPEDGEILLYRPKEKYDGAIPSGNSVMAYSLTRLALLCADTKIQEEADRQLAFYYNELTSHPFAYSFAMIPMVQLYSESKELICILQDQKDIDIVKDVFSKHFSPNITCVIKTPENSSKLASVAHFTQNYEISPEHRFVFYLCKGMTCSRPFYEIDELEAIFK